MKDFHQNFPFTKTNFYNTVELNVFPYNPKRLASNKVDRFQYTSLNSRSNRYDELLERSKI